MDQASNQNIDPNPPATGPLPSLGYQPGQAPQGMHRPGAHRPRKSLITTAVGLVVALAIGFASGMASQKGQDDGTKTDKDTNASQGQSQNQAPGSNSGRGRLASVTAVNATSIAATIQRTGESRTYVINAETKVKRGDAAATVADLKAGDKVLIQSNDDGTAASQITIVPADAVN